MQQEIKVRELAEQFYKDEYERTADPTRRIEVSQEKETWIGCYMKGFRAGEQQPAAYQTIQNIQLTDIDAPVFTHSEQFRNHFDYIKKRFLEILGTENRQPVEQPEWDSERIIGRVKERFKELEAKQWDWRSFYNGWLEGRSDMLQQIKGWGEYKNEQKENEAVGFSEWLTRNYCREANNFDMWIDYRKSMTDMFTIAQLYNEYQKQNNANS